MDGRFRTPILVEKWGYQRKGTTYYPPVSKSFHPWKRTDNRTHERIKRQPATSHNLYGTCHQSTTIYVQGRSPQRISTIRKTIQRRRIKTIPTRTSLGSRHRVQEGCTRGSRLQGIPHEPNQRCSSAEIHQR